MALEKEKKAQSAGGTHEKLEAIDRATSSAASPAAVVSPSTSTVLTDPASTAPYAGKFDPKAIAKKATQTSIVPAKLGTDIALPEIIKTSATSQSTPTGSKANTLSASAKLSSGK